MGDKSHLDFGDSSPETSLMHSGTATAEPTKPGSAIERQPDFSGWATKAGLKCSDGRTIMKGAFAHQDKAKVPLVWQHGHNDVENVLGHTILENRDEGVYAYGYFNDTVKGKSAKTLIEHEDIDSLSIFANQLIEKAKQVSHGVIREVSLVLARANPGALIDNITLQHSDGELVTIDDEAIITTGLELKHGDDATEDPEGETTDPGDGGDVDVQEIYDEMDDDQKAAVHFMVGAALEASATTDPGGNPAAKHSGTDPDDNKEHRTMSRNVFEQQNPGSTPGEAKHELSHDAMKGIFADADRMGSLKEAVEAYALQHGIDNLELLFPEARNVTSTPEFDKRRTEWVAAVWNGTKKSPFSRVKSLVADLTMDEARARGYIKGSFKKEEFFGLTKRSTTPTTVYKKQKLDRDDILDITDFDIVPWMKGEMRLMLEEELCRCILIGDGRSLEDDDKVRDPQAASDGAGIRSILHDHDLYAPKVNIDLGADEAAIVDEIVRQRSLYKGSGSPTFYTTNVLVTKLLLARDTLGRRLYRTVSDLAAELNVSSIVEVEVLESEADVVGIMVNLQDYNIGSDRGGEVALFDDFDIDYNQYKYLIETRLSGALIKIRSAIVFKTVADASNARVATKPAFDGTDITIPTVTGVEYHRGDTDAVVADAATITLDENESLEIYAVAEAGSHFVTTKDTRWTFINRGPLTGRDAIT